MTGHEYLSWCDCRSCKDARLVAAVEYIDAADAIRQGFHLLVQRDRPQEQTREWTRVEAAARRCRGLGMWDDRWELPERFREWPEQSEGQRRYVLLLVT